jgi:hypothetical protein
MSFNNEFTQVEPTQALITQGTFLPTVTGTTTNPTFSGYIVREGRWTKIGNRVIIDVQILTNTVTASGTGFLQVSNLPFTFNQSIRTVGTFLPPLGGETLTLPIRPALMETGYDYTGVVFIYVDDNNDITFVPIDISPFNLGNQIDLTFHIEYFI